MTTRRIPERWGISKPVLEKLAKLDLDRVDKFMCRSEVDLLQELDLPFSEVTSLKTLISSRLTPAGQTLHSLLEREQDQVHLKSGIPLLDFYLGGGIAPNCITEIVGAPGIGKTQLCHMLAVASLEANQDSNVLYIDGENAFSAVRIKELLEYSIETRRSESVMSAGIAKTISRIVVKDIRSSVDFTTFLSTLDKVILEMKVKLLVVDSIAALVRHEFDASSIFKRQNLLNNWASLLKETAEKWNIQIVVTNQVASSMSSGANMDTGDAKDPKVFSSVAALGTGWYHCVNTRLTLQKCLPSDFSIPSHSALAIIKASTPPNCTPGTAESLRCLCISKSPLSPVVSFPYFITRSGLCLLLTQPFGQAMEVDEQDIANTYVSGLEPGNYWYDG